MKPILEVRNLSISFTHYTSGLSQQKIEKVRNINLEVYPGEVLAIIGASGSGKSLFAHSLLGILPDNATLSGELFYKNAILDDNRIKKIRGEEIVLVPQTVDALDPLIKVGKQVQLAVKKGDPVKKQREAFARYQLDQKVAEMYPHEISGGMARKVLVSIAFLSNARLIIADEPTPGMDSQAINETLYRILNFRNKRTAVVMIMHDVSTALEIADRIALFLDGEVIEVARTEQFKGKGEKLVTSYAKKLWNALPQNSFKLINES